MVAGSVVSAVVVVSLLAVVAICLVRTGKKAGIARGISERNLPLELRDIGTASDGEVDMPKSSMQTVASQDSGIGSACPRQRGYKGARVPIG